MLETEKVLGMEPKMAWMRENHMETSMEIRKAMPNVEGTADGKVEGDTDGNSDESSIDKAARDAKQL